MKVFIGCLLMCLVTGGAVYWLSVKDNKRIAVVDAIKLFNSYDMKKELENQAKGKLEMASKQLDSISNKLQLAQAEKNKDEMTKLYSTYAFMKQRFQEQYAKSNQDINEQVWKRLNAAVDDYGKKKGFHLIIGANGMGSVLYNDDYYDMTSDVIKYVNKRYEEGN